MDATSFEVGYFGHKARQEAGALLMQRLIEKPCVRLHAIARDHNEEVRFGRFLRKSSVTLAEMNAHCERAMAPRAAGRHVLAIQDTTELNYQRHAGRTRGLGPVGNGTDRGLFLHPVLAIDADSGHCLGLAGAEIWTRDEQDKPDRHQRAIADKESFRWLWGSQCAKHALSEATRITVVSDREGEIYEEWVATMALGEDLLVRSKQDRRTLTGKLYAAMDRWPAQCCYTVHLARQAGKREGRTAQVELRFGADALKRPQPLPRTLPGAVSISVVDVREIAAPATETPVHWRLLSTHAVTCVEDALQLVDWYVLRWNIEQLFWTLKRQGFDLESSQLETSEALKKLAFMATQAATRVMELVRARDGSDPRPAEDLFSVEEVEVLAELQGELEGRTERQKNPWPARSLAWASWTVARLGGWKGYSTSESPAGPLTMRRGLERFEAICQGYALHAGAHRGRQSQPPDT